MATEHLAPPAALISNAALKDEHRPVARSSSSRLYRRTGMVAWAFMLPLLLINGIVVIGPALASVFYAFTDWSGLGDANWIGLANFQHLFVDADFHAAFLHNMIWTAFFLVVPLSLGLLGAFLLSQISRFQMFFRIAFFLPYTASSVVVSEIWRNLLNPDIGLARTGIPFLKGVYFLGDKHLALFSVAYVNNWAFWGFLMVIFLAAMQSVSTELYDAARVDGANRWQQFMSVTIPGIRPTLVFIVQILIIWSLVTFDYVYILTGGGPAGSTDVVSTLMYRTAFTLSEPGYAAAMALSLSFITAGVVGFFAYLRRKGWEI